MYSELDSKIYGIPNKNIADLLDLSAPDGLYRVDPAAKNNPVGTYGICEVRSTDDGKGWRFVTFMQQHLPILFGEIFIIHMELLTQGGADG